MADDGGVLGNLPRSRPGHRSEKRTGKAAKATPKPPSPPPTRTAAPPTGEIEGDPGGGLIGTVVGVAGIGARVAGGVAREVMRRIPRP